jgi:hypothetical protein
LSRQEKRGWGAEAALFFSYCHRGSQKAAFDEHIAQFNPKQYTTKKTEAYSLYKGYKLNGCVISETGKNRNFRKFSQKEAETLEKIRKTRSKSGKIKTF